MFICYCKLFLLINVARTSFAKNYCQEGRYGQNCELDCPKQCRPLQTFPCNKDTGRCSEGCINGYYGDHCDVTCSCSSGVCFQESGECIGTGTTTSSTRKNTTETIIATTAAPVCDGVEAGWLTTAIILIILITLLLCGVVMMFVCVRFTKQENSLKGTCEIRFCKAADANKEKGTGTAEIPLIQEESGKEATGGQSKIPKLTGDKSEETQQGIKLSTDVGELHRKIRQMEDEKRRIQEAMSRALSTYEYRENNIHSIFGLHKNNTNSTYHLMKYATFTGCKWLYSPHLMLDKEAVNDKVAQIDDKMVLLNIQDQYPGNKGKRFQHFQGTSCTWPLSRSNFYQYFEAVFDISLKQPIGEETIVFQLGFCNEKEVRDKNSFIKSKANCFVVQAVSSTDHNKVCLVSIFNGKILHVQELMNNVQDSETQVAIGICLNKEMKEIGVYDCHQPKLLLKTHINIGEMIWPMFGVCAENEASVSVRLIAGRDIPMWQVKQQTIRELF